MKEYYSIKPNTADLFVLQGQTDVIVRRGIKKVSVSQTEAAGKDATQEKMWECEEAQFRYPGVLSRTEVESQIDKWFAYAGAESMSELDKLKAEKIDEMSEICNRSIVSGIDVILSDGKAHHFSLSITDQIMISSLALKASQGQTLIPWHADGEECRFFSAAEISSINATMESLITYHETYFNSLKHYILSMDSIDDVMAVVYGTAIPEDRQSEVMKALIDGGDK